jgi:hypothetical protein
LEGSITHVWEERRVPDGGHTYRVNRRHPIIKEALDLKSSRPAVSSAIRLIEETIPVNLITARFSEKSLDQEAPFQRSEAEVISMMHRLARTVCETMTPAQIREMLVKLEPFAHYPELVAAARFCAEADE